MRPPRAGARGREGGGGTADGGDAFDAAAPAIEDVLAQIAAEAPAAVWDALPPDLSDHLDRYLYGEMTTNHGEE